jgi:nucleotide-binding universal stress UspA family protein
MQRKVLIPLDGSRFMRQILPCVQKVLAPENYELVLLRVAVPAELMLDPPIIPAITEVPLPLYHTPWHVEREKRQPLAEGGVVTLPPDLEEEMARDVRVLEDAGFTVSTVVRYGDYAEEIIQFARENEVDLIAMATHARKGMSRIVFGSNAERVLHCLPAPVMLLRVT